MRQLVTPLTIATICILAAGCGSGSNQGTKTSTASPIAEAALEGLLLSPAEINTAMGATGMTLADTVTSMSDDTKNGLSDKDKECAGLWGVAEAPVYGPDGYSAVGEQHLREPANKTHAVDQAVVLFPSANKAASFFTASTQSWSRWSNRDITDLSPPPVVWHYGPVSNTNATLSVGAKQTKVLDAGYSVHGSWGCQHALTVRNNVAIDISACSESPSGQGVNIANQIAAKVAAQ